MATPKKSEITIHVLLNEEDGVWFAQGVEVDYAAHGSSEDAVKHHFETGFRETAQEHIKVYGTAKYFLARKAPPDVMEQFRAMVNGPAEEPNVNLEYVEAIA